MIVRRRNILFILFVLSNIYIEGGEGVGAWVTVDQQEVNLLMGESATLLYYLHGNVTGCTTLSITVPDKQVVNAIDGNITVCGGDYEGHHEGDYVGPGVDQGANEGPDQLAMFNLTVFAVHAGMATLTTQASSEDIDVSEAFVVVSVMRAQSYDTTALVMGWISTIAWDVSYLPQIWHNYSRHSVAGLSFDFLTLNLFGFFCYLVFNAGLYWSPAMQDEYSLRHPNEVLHVRLNDVIFPLYAVLCTALQILQAFYYERSPGQRVSTSCRIVCVALLSVMVVSFILVPTVQSVWWLDVLYLMSYIKLFTTVVKYVPQLLTNHKAKSTAGYSIGRVLLDFAGGVFSLLQMFLMAANYDDWNSVLTDPTKLFLGVLAIAYNMLFIVQHCCLYRNAGDPYIEKMGKAEDKEKVIYDVKDKAKYEVKDKVMVLMDGLSRRSSHTVVKELPNPEKY